MKAIKTNKHLDYFGFATDCIFFDESHCQGADERYCERSDRKGYDPNCKECEFYYNIEMARAMIEDVQKFWVVEEQKPEIVLKNDGIYMKKQIDEHAFETVPIITKEVFPEAFAKLIECEEQYHEHTD